MTRRSPSRKTRSPRLAKISSMVSPAAASISLSESKNGRLRRARAGGRSWSCRRPSGRPGRSCGAAQSAASPPPAAPTLSIWVSTAALCAAAALFPGLPDRVLAYPAARSSIGADRFPESAGAGGSSQGIDESRHGKADHLRLSSVIASAGARRVRVFLAFWNSPAAVGASRKGAARCPLSEVTGAFAAGAVDRRASVAASRAWVGPAGSSNRCSKAFLEMLAAERGAARLTLAAYRNDLPDLAGFLDGTRVALEAADAADAARLSRARRRPRGWRRARLARRISAMRQFYQFLLLDGRAAGRPDRRSRHAAARPAAAEDSIGSRGRATLISGAPARPGDEGVRLAASSSCCMRPACASPSW